MYRHLQPSAGNDGSRQDCPGLIRLRVAAVLLGVAGAAHAAASAPASSSAPASTQAERPNIVLICLDGVSAAATGFGGNSQVKTPNMDRLRADGVLFTRAYTTVPLAAGSRASMLTGQYPHTHGLTNEKAQLSTWAITFTEVLDRSGYACGLVGDWRLPEPPAAPGAAPTTPMANALPPNPQAGMPGPSSPGNLNPIAAAAHPPETPPGANNPQFPRPPPNMQTMPRNSVATMPGPPATQPMRGPSSRPMMSNPSPRGPGMSPASTAPPGSTPVPAAPASAMPPVPAIPPPAKPGKPGLGFNRYYAVAATAVPGPSADSSGQAWLNGEPAKVSGYLPDWYTERAQEFIRQSKSKPFCLCVFYPGPREPLTCPPGAESAYPPAKLPLPSIRQPDPKLMTALQNTDMSRNAPKQPEALREKQAKYLATIARMDENVGRILAALDEAGVSAKTMVVLTSAQGFSTGENSLWGSGPAFWDPFIHCPLVVRPALKNIKHGALANVAVDEPVGLLDIAPTLLEAVGLPVPMTMQGRSLLPLVGGNRERGATREIYIEYESQNGQSLPARVILAGQFKLVDYLQSTDQFFDLKRDPKEERNLVDDPAYAAMVKVMRSRLDTWRKRTKDSSMPR